MSARIQIDCQRCGKTVECYPSQLRMFCSYTCSCASLRERQRPRMTYLDPDYFWSFVCKGDDNGCWEWTGQLDRHGYGHIGVSGRSVLTHRHAWALTHGPISDGMFCLHHCDNPPCVRPDHLFLGTQRDNIADMVAKRRQQRGESNGGAVLTEDGVRDIRRRAQMGETHTAIAASIGMSRAAVSLIAEGKRWRHVA
jgi:hypothetical protein